MKRMRINNHRFAHISSMHELRAVRHRMEWEVENSEDRLRGEWCQIKSMFTMHYASNYLVGKLSDFGSLTDFIIGGYNVVTAMIHKIRRKKHRPSLSER